MNVAAAPVTHDAASQRNAVIAGFLGWTLDAFDFFVLTFVLSDVAQTFGRSRPDIALTITLALATRPIGAVIFGVMADRIGRKIPLMLNVLSFAFLSVASGLAPDYRAFLILRLLFGVAMGGQWGVGASLALESVPARLRGVLSGLLQQGYAAGNLLAAVAFRTIYPAYGWRAMFIAGGLPALLSIFIFFGVKESPVWHEHRTGWRHYGASALQHWPRFLYLTMLMALVAMIAHGTQDMYPTFLQRTRGFTVQQTADITILGTIAACIGGVVFGWFSDRIGRRRTMVLAASLGLVTVPLWIAAPTTALIVLGVCLMQAWVQGGAAVVPAHFNELTPGHLRGFFPGLAYQLGVLVAASITYIEALLGEHFTYVQAMGVLVAGIYLVGAIVFAIGPENKGVSFAKSPR